MHHFRWITVGLIVGFLLLWSQHALAQARTSSTSSTSQKAGLRGDAMIQYDTDTGTLIVISDEKTNEEIRKVVDAMDLPVAQVLIKVLFLEVTHTKDLELGFEGSRTKSKTHLFSTQVDTATLETIFGVGAQTTGGFYRIVEKDLEATIRALAEVTKLEVLSRPSILTRNNQEAVITVGKRVPFIQNSRITSDGQTINTVTYDDIGIILRVTPHISDDRVVSMDVTPEISTLTAETVPISNTVNAPVFATRSAETGVVVPDGKTVVIGGLMEDSKTKNTKKIPLLGDIPVIGAAFQSKNDSKTKTELLIFLTPHVVENANELDSVSSSEKAKAALTPKSFDSDQMEKFLDQHKAEAPAKTTELKTKDVSEIKTTVETQASSDTATETAPEATTETTAPAAPEKKEEVIVEKKANKGFFRKSK